jgi:hypothetical protein
VQNFVIMQVSPKLVDLRPNRSLLNSDFDGYKLSLRQIPTVTEQLETPVDRLVPDINQYSLLHAKLYALHNHLIGESGDSESVYFIDKELNVQKYYIESLTNQFSSEIVWQVPLQRERVSGDYNVSMKFASDQFAVVADGVSYLYVLDRGSRDIDDKWKIIFSGDVTGPDQSFVIIDAVYRELQKPELHLLLISIRQRESSERHSSILHWITLVKTDTWNQVALRELTVKGFVQYANLERSCEAIYVVSDSGCKFTLDSENEIRKDQAVEIKKKYKWTQSKEDVTLQFPLPEDANKDSVKITTESTQIQVKYGNDVLIEGALYQRIDPDVTCWTLKNTTLEVVLQKCEPGLTWPETVEGDRTGEYAPDPAQVDEIRERLAPLTSDVEAAPPTGTTFNSQQVEECDFECDKLTIFERLCRDSHHVTHKINLGSHQVLLTVNFDKELPLAVATRSDVDACIWQPKMTPNDFCLEHTGILLALGYIQASKQQMKFFTCSPDLSYSVICESTKHLFIYCQNKTIASNELRNRITGRRVNTLAQQQVYNLPSNDDILGVYASNTYLYVLGENFITALKL